MMNKMNRTKKFIDSIRVLVKGGCGGHGIKKYGGVGGKGGDVFLEAEKFSGLNGCFRSYPDQCLIAANGENSKRHKIYGERGEDLIVKVPVGLAVYDERNIKIGELNKIGERLKVAHGGVGGSAKSKPPYNGSMGQERVITLDLKLIADIGLVGFPNAGKSTLLKAISRASPKIASYAFTTLHPNLGVVEYDDLRQISVADLPGLIEGASENVGMGHAFLKHVERTSVLLMLVDINGFQFHPELPHRSCVETVVLLNKELELYNKSLLHKPMILAVNKMDVPQSKEKLEEIMPALKNLKKYVKENIPYNIRPERIVKFKKILPISARFSKDSVTTLKEVMRVVVEDHYNSKMSGVYRDKEKELAAEINRKNTEFGSASI